MTVHLLVGCVRGRSLPWLSLPCASGLTDVVDTSDIDVVAAVVFVEFQVAERSAGGLYD